MSTTHGASLSVTLTEIHSEDILVTRVIAVGLVQDQPTVTEQIVGDDRDRFAIITTADVEGVAAQTADHLRPPTPGISDEEGIVPSAR
jgi:hypothetical protein